MASNAARWRHFVISFLFGYRYLQRCDRFKKVKAPSQGVLEATGTLDFNSENQEQRSYDICPIRGLIRDAAVLPGLE